MSKAAGGGLLKPQKTMPRGVQLNSTWPRGLVLKTPTQCPQSQVKQTRRGEERRELNSNQSRDDLTTEGELEITRLEDQRIEAQFPTKGEILEMFKRLENSIKTEINMLRTDLRNLVRIETAEEIIDKQALELCVLKEEVKSVQQNQANLLYRLEDQENRNSKQNFRIRSVPERRGGRPEESHMGNFLPSTRCGPRRFSKYRTGTPGRKIRYYQG